MTLRDSVATSHLERGEGRQLRLITDLVTIKATTADTGDAFALFETETPPAGGCPPHRQRYDDEAFFVLDGRYAFLAGDEQVELGPGGYLYVPRGTVHAFTNVGSTTARMLVLVAPGGIHQQFLDEVGDRAGRAAWEADINRLLEVAPKYGIEFPTSVTAEGPDSE